MEPFLGEIRLMGFGLVPRGWAQCNGQLVAVNSNQALFALLGTAYGGNGVSTFGLPDLRGRVPIGMGQGTGLQSYPLGQISGTENVTLQAAHLPAHTHQLVGTLKATLSATGNNPDGNYPAQSAPTNPNPQYSTGTPNANMAGPSLAGSSDNAGSSQAHENRQPLLALNYCIALQGIFPSRA